MEENIIMPRLGQEMTEGTIIQWYKKEGEEIKENEPLFLVETDKATIDVESEVAGVIKRLIIGENEVASVGQIVAIIERET